MGLSGKPEGFTLIELLIILFLLGIMVMFAIPGFNQFISSNRVQSANNELMAILQYARTYAAEHRSSVSVCIAEDGGITVESTCDGANVLRRMASPVGATISTSAEEIQFFSNGSADTAGAGAISFTTCHDDDFASGFTVTVMPTGAIRTYGRGMKATAAMSEC